MNKLRNDMNSHSQDLCLLFLLYQGVQCSVSVVHMDNIYIYDTTSNFSFNWCLDNQDNRVQI